MREKWARRALLGIMLVLAMAHVSLARVQTGPEIVEPTILVFYEEDCPDCTRMEGLLDQLLTDHPTLTVAHYEINQPGAPELLWSLSSHYNIIATSVPIIFVGEEAIMGAGRAEEMRLRTAIGDCISLGCSSPLAHVEGVDPPWEDLLLLGLFASLLVFFLIVQGG